MPCQEPLQCFQRAMEEKEETSEMLRDDRITNSEWLTDQLQVPERTRASITR